MQKIVFLLVLVLQSSFLFSQESAIPKVYSNINSFEGEVFYNNNGRQEPIFERKKAKYFLSSFENAVEGTENGVKFDFNDVSLNGKLYYGFIKLEGTKFPQPVFFKRTAKIEGGKAKINIIKNLSGKYDFLDWEENGKICLGYRVLNEEGKIIFDGRINLEGKGPFTVATTLVEGPFINKVTPSSVVISFKTNSEIICSISIDGKVYSDKTATKSHEILVNKLEDNTKYNYNVIYGASMESYSFKTAVKEGERAPFTFAFASDSRNGKGGGERNIYGTNAYIMKKMSTLALKENAVFFQFTGDMINGYKTNNDVENLQYANWKKSVEYYWRFAPFYVGMGNHEAMMTSFENGVSVDKFPFEEYSAEATFAKNMVNFENGPISEDGADYDPDTYQIDFPSYKENVYFYTYGNIAMIVLNSNYWYAPSTNMIPHSSGNLHGYIMDQQLEWLKSTLSSLENNDNIDHIFITLHTPPFPNGGHSKDDMWYSGNNDFRAYVAGKPLEYGIIERRDQFLDLIINKSKKALVVLNGDEHNYSRLLLSDSTNIYPPMWDKEKLELSRSFWQITNGAAGAPYYSQEELPWSDDVKIFSQLNALMLFHVDGDKVELEVINPDTFEEVETVILRD